MGIISRRVRIIMKIVDGGYPTVRKIGMGVNKTARGKKGKQNKNKGKQNKNKGKQNKKQVQKPKKNPKNLIKEENKTEKSEKKEKVSEPKIEDIKVPPLDKAKTLDISLPKSQNIENLKKNNLKNSNENLKMNSKLGKIDEEEKVFDGPPQFFNKSKLINYFTTLDITNENCPDSTSSERVDLENKLKSQRFKTKSSANNSFKEAQSSRNANPVSLQTHELYSQQSNSQDIDYQKHANHSEIYTEGQQNPSYFQSYDPSSIPTPHLPQSFPAKPYPIGNHPPAVPTQNIEYNQAQDPTYMHYLYEIYIYQKLTKEIDQQTSEITIMVNMIQKYRFEIKDEIERVAYHTFGQYHQNINAHIYGSVATELALPESDMDILITGVNSFGSKDAHQENITYMFEGLKEYFGDEIMIKSNKILNTEVPIIKLTFNLSKYYEICINSGKTSLPFINFDSIDSINPHLRELSVDISISNSIDGSHHVLKQNNFVREKLEEFPVLRPVCLILKKLLVTNGFNDPYTGGLGSFGLFIMLYAALYFELMNTDVNFQNETTDKGRLFVYFLSMYGESLDIEKKMIFFFNDGMPMVIDKLTKSFFGSNKLLCVYDPTNIKNNITSKAFRIQEIQKFLRETKLQ